jgi:hypothetical protein
MIVGLLFLHAALAQPETVSTNTPHNTSSKTQTEDHRVPVFTAVSVATVPTSAVPDPPSVATAGFQGSIPAMFYLSDQNNEPLVEAELGDLGITGIGGSSLLAPEPLVIRLRSNLGYALSVQASGIPDLGADCIPGRILREISACDIGFGVRRVVNTGASVVNPRHDTVPEKFRAADWPDHSSANGHEPHFGASLHDISAADTSILSGTRISATGNNNSEGNFIEVELGVALLHQQFLTPSAFSGTVTLTIAPQHP